MRNSIVGFFFFGLLHFYTLVSGAPRGGGGAFDGGVFRLGVLSRHNGVLSNGDHLERMAQALFRASNDLNRSSSFWNTSSGAHDVVPALPHDLVALAPSGSTIELVFPQEPLPRCTAPLSEQLRGSAVAVAHMEEGPGVQAILGGDCAHDATAGLYYVTPHGIPFLCLAKPPPAAAARDAYFVSTGVSTGARFRAIGQLLARFKWLNVAVVYTPVWNGAEGVELASEELSRYLGAMPLLVPWFLADEDRAARTLRETIRENRVQAVIYAGANAHLRNIIVKSVADIPELSNGACAWINAEGDEFTSMPIGDDAAYSSALDGVMWLTFPFLGPSGQLTTLLGAVNLTNQGT